jgi:hypothetical protein
MEKGKPEIIKIPRELLKVFEEEPKLIIDLLNPRGIMVIDKALLKALQRPEILSKVQAQFDIVLVPKTAER